ncbi:MFS transporter (Mch2) [Apiospora arundinis]
MTWIIVAPPCLVAEVVALELRQSAFGTRSYVYVQAFAGISYILSSFFLLELWRACSIAHMISVNFLAW